MIRAARARAGLFAAVAAALVLLAAASGAAQVTGSSGGGGSWGSSSSSSSGGSSGSWGSSGSSSYGSTSGGPAYEPSLGGQCLIAIVWLASVVLIFKLGSRLLRRLEAAGSAIHVSQLQLAIDPRARAAVQRELASALAGADTRSVTGLAALLHAAASTLRSARASWIYAGAKRLDPMAPEAAQAAHAQLAIDARARFRKELVRAEAGAVRTEDAPELRAREHEGEGVVVVTLVVATRKRLPAVDPARPDQLERVVNELATLASDRLVAVELIWSPSVDEDRMSTAELEAIYPELHRLGAFGGRVLCAHCGGPFAAELPKCPHCGAPTDRAPSAGASP